MPRIGAVLLHRVTADTLDMLYDDLEESGGRNRKGCPPRRWPSSTAYSNKALADAVKRGKPTTNPADAVEAPRAGPA
ncbi:MAG: hypothetical protein ACRDYA_01260 [Egibacteraceae bacterium]